MGLVPIWTYSALLTESVTPASSIMLSAGSEPHLGGSHAPPMPQHGLDPAPQDSRGVPMLSTGHTGADRAHHLPREVPEVMVTTGWAVGELVTRCL